MEGPVKKSKSKLCRHCRDNDVYEYENTFDGVVYTIQDDYCLECIKKSKDELNCRFCNKLMGYKYGYEYAGDDQGLDWCGCELVSLSQYEKDVKNGLLVRVPASCKIVRAQHLIMIETPAKEYVCVTHKGLYDTFSIPKEFDDIKEERSADDDIVRFALGVTAHLDKWFWYGFGHVGILVFRVFPNEKNTYTWSRTCPTPIRIEKQDDGQIAFWKLEKIIK